MFNNFGDHFETPTVCQMIAAVCDPRTKRLSWCDVFEKVTYRVHTIDVIVVAMMPSKSRVGVGATSTGGAAPDACAMPRRNTPACEDDRKKEDLDHADLPFAEILETRDMSASEEATTLSPQSPEAILAETRRIAGYRLTQYAEGKTLHPTASAQAVLQWWFDQSHIYPFLYKMVCVYLAAPASSGSSERVFSSVGNIVTKKRNRLGSELVNNLIFLHGCHGVGCKMGQGIRKTRNVGR